MAGIDAAGVNEKLNGLITLLQSVGIDGLDQDAIAKKKKTDSDSQILDLVKKLQQAQADSPEILEALKSPELLVLAGLAAQKQGLQAPEPPKPAPSSLDDVFDDDDDNFPKIGPGYSDDISVISELSTPTVMTRQSVAEEEYYKEIGGKPGGQGIPPSIAGGLAGTRLRAPMRSVPNRVGAAAGKLGGGKSKNMLGQVRPITPRRTIPTIPPYKSGGGGAAAQRRLNYQMAMNKLEEEGFGSPLASEKPKVTLSPRESKRISRTISGNKSIGSGGGGSRGGGSRGGTSRGSSKRKPRSERSKTTDDIEWGTADENGWPAFTDFKNNSSDPNLFIDADGFFSDDVFANDQKGPKSSKSGKKKSSSDAGSTTSGGKKKSRDDRSRKGRSSKKERDAYSDDEREGSTRKSRVSRREKERDALSDDGTGTSRKSRRKDRERDREKDKEKVKRKTSRRATMQT